MRLTLLLFVFTVFQITLSAQTCGLPIGLGASSITQTSAQITWTNAAGVSSIYMDVYPGEGLAPEYTLVAGNSFSADDLVPGTIHTIYYRSACPDGSMGSSGHTTFTTLPPDPLCNPAEQCIYQFVLTETFGDSWNGNLMTVTQNGQFVATLDHGWISTPVVTRNIVLCDAMPFELFWNEGGNFPNEVGVNIINPFGEVIFSKPPGTGSQGTMLYTGLTNCIADMELADSSINTWQTFPNPATSYLTISGNELINRIEVFDITGRLVKSLHVNETTSMINVSSFTKGLYVLKIQSSDMTQLEKILVN